MKKRVLVLFTATAILALAQGPGPQRMGRPMGGPEGPGGPGGGGMMGLARIGARTVKGAPFQATTVTESVQILSDGNRVTNRHTGKVYRDGEGRTRTESVMTGFGAFRAQERGLTMVSIDDPVAQQHVILDTNRKTASRMTMQARPAGPEAKGMERWGAGPRPEAVRGPRPDAGAAPERKSESLGTQVMEGVQVQGTRVTMTIPAGAMGNDRAIEIVTETWYSPELQTVVYRKHSDPRSGENIYRLTEIQRAEPDKSLFQVPADYTTRSGRSGGRPPAEQ